MRSIREKWGNFIFLQIAFYAAHACYSPYIVLFMTERGLSTTTAGLVVTINGLVSILLQPFWGMLCDRLHSVKKVCLFCLAILTFLIPTLGFVHQSWLIILWIPLINVFFCSMFAFMDSWVVQGVKEIQGKNYGNVRVWGSIGYMIAVALSGQLTEKYFAGAAFIGFSILSVIAISIGLCINNEGISPDVSMRKSASRFRDLHLGTLLKNKRYLLFILCAAMVRIPFTAHVTYLPNRILLAGGDSALYGICMSLGALSEVPALFLSNRIIRRFGPAAVVQFSLMVYVLQLSLFACPLPAEFLPFIQLVQGGGYGLFIVGAVHYIDQLAPSGLKTSALTLASATYDGIAGMIGSSLGGILIDQFGMMTIYPYAALWAACSAVIYIIASRWMQKKQVINV